MLGIINPSEPSTFIRCVDVLTKKEMKLRTFRLFPNALSVRIFLLRHFRNLEYREHAPWNDAEHGGGILYSVPIQNVLFDPPKKRIEPPGRIRNSVLVRERFERKPFPRNPILKGA